MLDPCPCGAALESMTMGPRSVHMLTCRKYQAQVMSKVDNVMKGLGELVKAIGEQPNGEKNDEVSGASDGLIGPDDTT
eukprot:g49753.t1